MRIAIVLYDGNLGGAEKVTVELASTLRGAGVEATVVFVRDPKGLAADLDRHDVPYVTFGARRVEEVLLRPRRFARLVAEHGPDGALLPAIGHQAPALRIGGYAAPVVAMEHGILLLMPRMPLSWRLPHALDRRLSARFVDAVVAVSDFMLDALRREGLVKRTLRIYNGVSVRTRPDLSGHAHSDGVLTYAHAARLIEGKGTDTLIEAFARSESQRRARLLIAGDGPERPRLQRLVESLGLTREVEFSGAVEDMLAFWSQCDVAILPSTSFVESFGMVAVEAMSLGKPVIATRNGGVPEVLGEDAGIIVDPDDPAALASALNRYASDAELRSKHGARGRRRCEEQFSIERCAADYAHLFAELGGAPLPAPTAALEEVHA